MAKNAKAKKAKPSGKSKRIFSLTKRGLKQAGAKRFTLPPDPNADAATGAHPATHKTGSVIVAPGPGGTTIVCEFNPNTGNFDICHTVAGKGAITA